MTVTNITEQLRDPYMSRETISYADLQSTFHNEKMRNENMKSFSYGIQRDLNGLFKAGDLFINPKELDDDAFAACYDPGLPTIAIEPETTFTGSELLGLAAHEPDTRANVVFVSSVTDCVSIRTNEQDGSSYLEVTHGAFVLPSGQVAYGELPHPIRADALETADTPILAQAEAAGITAYHSTDTMARYSDKNIMDTLTTSDNVYAPPKLTKDELFAAPTADNLVIKPSKNSQGRGVLLTDENADVEYVKRYYQFLEDKGYDPVIEKRARSYEMIDPKTGERLDWNVRAILSYGDSLGMYIRADKWGEPVNMSISAKAISLEEFPDYFPDRSTGEELIKILQESAQSLAEENPTSFIGADITIDEDKRACVFELNNGHSGGMQTIAKLENTYDGIMAMPRRVLGKFIAHTPISTVNDIHTDSVGTPLEPSLTTLAFAVQNSSERKRLGMLAVEDVPHDDSWRFGTVMALVAIRSATYLHDIFNDLPTPTADDVLIEKYPLEARRYLVDLKTTLGNTVLNRYLKEYDGVIQDDVTSLALKAGMMADEFDLDGFNDIVKRAAKNNNVTEQSMYDYAHSKFLKRFIGPLGETESEDKIAFGETLENVITTYFHDGYQAADKVLLRKIESAGTMTPESRLLHVLRFSVAASTSHFDDAVRILRQSIEEHDPDDTSFFDYYIEHYGNSTLHEMEKMSQQELDFQLDLAAEDNNLLPTAADMLYCVQVGAISKSKLEHIAFSIAAKATYEGSDEDRQLLYSLARKITEEPDDEYRDIMSRDLASMSIMQQITCVLFATLRGNAQRTKEIYNFHRDNDIWENGVDYVMDTYIDNPQDWGR